MGRSPWWLPWAVYGPVGVLGAGASWLTRGTVLDAPPAPRLASASWLALGLGLALALLVTSATVRSTRWLVARARWAQRLHLTLRGALLGAPTRRLLSLAVGSAVAEELFFRAALLPSIGLVASSLVFGLLHVSSRDTYLGWMLWASLMGFVFGLLYLGSGSLLPAMLAHAAINYENMQYVCSHDPTGTDSAGACAQAAPARRL